MRALSVVLCLYYYRRGVRLQRRRAVEWSDVACVFCYFLWTGSQCIPETTCGRQPAVILIVLRCKTCRDPAIPKRRDKRQFCIFGQGTFSVVPREGGCGVRHRICCGVRHRVVGCDTLSRQASKPSHASRASIRTRGPLALHASTTSANDLHNAGVARLDRLVSNCSCASCARSIDWSSTRRAPARSTPRALRARSAAAARVLLACLHRFP